MDADEALDAILSLHTEDRDEANAAIDLAFAVLAEVERRLGAHDTLSFSRVGTPADKSKAAMLREILTLARARARVGEEE